MRYPRSMGFFDPPAPSVPWDKLPAEDQDAFALFQRYLHGSIGNVTRWAREAKAPQAPALAARYRWRARREALQVHLAREAADAAEDEARRLGREHARVLAQAREWAEDSILAARAKGETLDPREAAALLKLAIDGERLQAGQATSRVGVDLSKASDEDLAALEAALDRVEGRPTPPRSEG